MSKDIKQPPDSLGNLKFVLSTISNIRAMSLEVELRYRDIQERYRMLDVYQIPVDEEQVKMVQEIEPRWKDLFTEAKMVDRSLIVVKKKFTVVS